MQKKSSPFVKIEYLDKPAIAKAIARLVEELSQKYPEIERISLFGSFARDEAVPGSDVDILIVLTDSDLPFKDRITKYMPSSFPVGIDVFPYTRSEMEAMLDQGNYFLKSAEEDSIVLFTR
jgi:predicted nucleotidyltransferase